jgi:hypothetical protein
MGNTRFTLDDFSLDELEQLMTFFTRAYFVKIARISAAQDGSDDWREDNPTLAESILRALKKIQQQENLPGQSSNVPIL